MNHFPPLDAMWPPSPPCSLASPPAAMSRVLPRIRPPFNSMAEATPAIWTARRPATPAITSTPASAVFSPTPSVPEAWFLCRRTALRSSRCPPPARRPTSTTPRAHRRRSSPSGVTMRCMEPSTSTTWTATWAPTPGRTTSQTPTRQKPAITSTASAAPPADPSHPESGGARPTFSPTTRGSVTPWLLPTSGQFHRMSFCSLVS